MRFRPMRPINPPATISRPFSLFSGSAASGRGAGPKITSAPLGVVGRTMTGADHGLFLFRPHVDRTALVRAHAGIGDHALGGPFAGFLIEAVAADARRDHQIEPRAVANRAVRIRRIGLRLRTAQRQIVTPDGRPSWARRGKRGDRRFVGATMPDPAQMPGVINQGAKANADFRKERRRQIKAVV